MAAASITLHCNSRRTDSPACSTERLTNCLLLPHTRRPKKYTLGGHNESPHHRSCEHCRGRHFRIRCRPVGRQRFGRKLQARSEEHTSELQSLMRISYAVFCLKKKKKKTTNQTETETLDNITNNRQNR